MGRKLTARSTTELGPRSWPTHANEDYCNHHHDYAHDDDVEDAKELHRASKMGQTCADQAAFTLQKNWQWMTCNKMLHALHFVASLVALPLE